MNVTSTKDIHDLMGAHFQSAVLNAALELGLFWRLLDGPQSVRAISQAMNIPPKRCRYWLGMLVGMNLLEQDGDQFMLSSVAHTTILNTYSQETWKMLAIDAQDNYENGRFLVQRLRNSISEKDQLEPQPSSYVQKMETDLQRARLFSEMLFELHSPLGQNVADVLDLKGARSLLDVGGGSGVVSLALLRKHPQLTAVVVDIPNVCTAGREIADTMPERDRITYQPANFLHDELPKGFDIVLECDVGRFDNLLLRKLAASLNEGGRLVIVDRWFDMGEEETPDRSAYLLSESLRDPQFSLRTLADIEDGLVQAGLEVETIVELPYKRWKMIQARKSPLPFTG